MEGEGRGGAERNHSLMEDQQECCSTAQLEKPSRASQESIRLSFPLHTQWSSRAQSLMDLNPHILKSQGFPQAKEAGYGCSWVHGGPGAACAGRSPWQLCGGADCKHAALRSYGAPGASTETSNTSLTDRPEVCHRKCLGSITPPGAVGAGYSGDHRKLSLSPTCWRKQLTAP